MVEASGQLDQSWGLTQVALAAVIESMARLVAEEFARGYRLLCRGETLGYLKSMNMAFHYPSNNSVKKTVLSLVIYSFIAYSAEALLLGMS